MINGLGTYSSRGFSVPGYSAPLFVNAMDMEEAPERPFESIIQEMLLVPQRRIVTVERWNLIAEMTLKILEDEAFWQRVIKEELGYTKAWRKPIEDLLAYYRVETARRFELIRQDHTFFAYQALKNLVYQASEGIGPGYEYGVPVALPFPRFSAILNDELTDWLEHDSDVRAGRDDLLVWRRVNSLVMGSTSLEFKASFAPLLEYEIPYGLSPKTKSDTLEAIIKHARTIAVIPVLSGLESTATALATQQWILALQAAATTGGVMIIFLSSVALSDVIVRWLKKREIEGNR